MINNQAEADTRLHGRALTLALAAWGVLVLITLTVLALAMFLLVRPDAVPAGTDLPYLVATGSAAQLVSWSLSLVYLALGIFIFWRRPNELVPLLVSAFLIACSMLLTPRLAEAGALLNVERPAKTEYEIQQILLVAILAPVMILFPNGRLAPRWTRWILLAVIPWEILTVLLPELQTSPADLSLLALLWSLSIALPAMATLIYRYGRVMTVAERQQTKWVVIGFAAWIAWLFLVVTPLGMIGSRGGTLIGAVNGIAWLLGSLIVPVTMTLAILRYRLFDIDLVIRRTATYSLLSGVLAFVYFSSVVVLQQLFRTLTGQTSEIAIIVSTLAIAALFVPLRRRIQIIIDRRFYRRKYDAQKVLAEFARTARDETDLQKLTERLIDVVDETMQPESVSLWLKPTKLDERQPRVAAGEMKLPKK